MSEEVTECMNERVIELRAYAYAYVNAYMRRSE